MLLSTAFQRYSVGRPRVSKRVEVRFKANVRAAGIAAIVQKT